MTPATITRGQSWKPILIFLAAAILLHAGLASIGWWNPIVERHGFRQTQTAITAFWLSRGSPLLAYETPVLGPPWSIPFEFPLYQWAISLWSRSTSIPIDQSGRIISLLFFYAGLVPVAWMVRRLRLPLAVFAAFALLYLASPLYLFWSRTVMVETAAMTLSLAYFSTAAVALYRPFRWRRCAAAAVFGALAALVKITTFAGALLPIGLLCLFLWIRRRPGIKAVLYSLVPLLLPLAAGLVWTSFADAIRRRNPLQFLNSDELVQWLYGTVSLRASKAFWVVMDHRMLRDVMGRAWTVILLATIVVAIARYRGRWIGVGSLAAIGFCVGPLVFANLYYVHDYYPCGAAAYLYLALAVFWGSVWHAKGLHPGITLGLLLIFLAGSAYTYRRNYYPDLSPLQNSFVDTGRFLKSALSPDEVLIIYGADWDSTIAYYSEHRAIMDRLYRSIHSAQMMNSLQNLQPGQRVGAVVGCSEALDGWYRARVLAAVASTGMSPRQAYDDGTCRAYLRPSNGRTAPVPDVSGVDGPPDTTWLRMPGLGGTPQVPQLRNRLLEDLPLVPLAPDPARLSAIEEPQGAAAILANPDTRMVLQLPPHITRVILGYGIKPYAWRVHPLPPVAFEVYAINGEQKTVIWRRSLDPAHQSRDRGVQESSVVIPPEIHQIILATTSTDATLSHRAYWSGIELR